ncbi:amidohydrolase [Nocardioides cavernae]|uniref:Amidohydrolase n=1 Tax=Nocardioides cavernae TaxID=1921566 RepID=A0ABR8NAN6_9ACTN|nr:amidohydrolase family protein [Nocardioides cavernae]MBD3924240.1 amidohydrolase [Nocardioides cavernae]MBM7510821.1 4-oxalmesaconate hydratase [Nocardioides cavernae]
MIVDTHAHYTTAPPQLDAYRARQLGSMNRPSAGKPLKISDDEILVSLEGHLKRMDTLGIDRMIFSPRASGMGHEIGDARVSLYWTKVNNDLIKRVCDLVPDRFIPAAQLPQSPGVSPAECVGELTRCVEELGFVGCNVNPDVAGGGQPFTPAISDEWWYPLWDVMVDLDVPGLVHASSTVNPALHLNGSHYTSSDAAVTFELCWSNLYDHYPALKLIVPHGGGSLPFNWNRHRALHTLQNKPPFEERIKNVYFDTALYDRDSMEMLIRKVGADNILYAAEPFGTAKATDPETGRLFDDTVSFVDDISWLSDEDKDKIFVGNARRLYSRAAL